MIILYDPIFGFGRMIVFHLIEWVTTSTKSLTKASRDFWNRSAFPIPANLTRHEVTCKSADPDDRHERSADELIPSIKFFQDLNKIQNVVTDITSGPWLAYTR